MITRETLITHILAMKQKDPDYARYALAEYNKSLPWLDLNSGVKDALKATP